MATLATFLRRFETTADLQVEARPALRIEPDPYRLRPFPNEDVFFYLKRVDNSRLVREEDPRSRTHCWSALGAASVFVILSVAVLTPGVAGIRAGYKIQELKAEEQRLLDERRTLELEEAELLSPARLQELAAEQRMVAPAPSQVVHLDARGDSSLALNVKK
jgi:cell division protein FtsL